MKVKMEKSSNLYTYYICRRWNAVGVRWVLVCVGDTERELDINPDSHA